ncbi:glycoside hydrolase superfamily [Podospora fimiseda]|uniref:alpha-galactosidase n=1 Tax=Podospora fimiseda TaxID=252190 RepID=A0AAN7BKK6_9PEZI|nr:glycoside hydrolase superfamily [Podospora fimiseda]
MVFLPFALLGLAALTQALQAVPKGFAPGVKWQIQIQSPMKASGDLIPSDAIVWDIDLYNAAKNPDTIPQIRSKVPGAIIMCYFNAGLVQKWDCDYDSVWAKSGLTSTPHPDFPDERFIDVRKPKAVELIQKRISLAQRIGCDAVDPDNIDTYLYDQGEENLTTFKLKKSDLSTFVKSLATFAHGLKTTQGNTMLIGQKNAPELTPDLSPVLDFAVLEDCSGRNDPGNTAPFCKTFQDAYIGSGKPVFSIEYPKSIKTGRCSRVDDGDYKGTCGNVGDKGGFSTVLKIKGGDRELDGCTQYCDGKDTLVTGTNPDADGQCPADAMKRRLMGRRARY